MNSEFGRQRDILILCDFDGTITEEDATALVWKGRIPLAERTRMVAAVTGGRWNEAKYVAYGYGFISAVPQDILGYLREVVRIRPGWNAFLACVARGNFRLHVLSNGLDFCVKEFIGSVASTSSLVSQFDGRYHVDLPHGCMLLPGEEFKAHCVSRLIAESQPSQTIYIGSSLSDHASALLCDRVFAIRNGALAKMRRTRGLPTVEFDSFDVLIETLQMDRSLRAYRGQNIDSAAAQHLGDARQSA